MPMEYKSLFILLHYNSNFSPIGVPNFPLLSLVYNTPVDSGHAQWSLI